MLDNVFKVVDITVVPQENNKIFDSLAHLDVNFKPPDLDHLSYPIQVMHKATNPNNIKQSQVFEYEEGIKRFMTIINEYSNLNIDSYSDEDRK
jgi:hypothetical protein